ncbi:Metallo-hydrolase/oxidoreductase [Phellopilus nigrolimitatus]|nr:Metallo-hydrolase/oxidoreductase [Phellopilus nigrolimitatus]
MTESHIVSILPPPEAEQAYCDVSALEGGFFQMPCNLVVTGTDENDRHVAPSLAFLLTHASFGKRLLFDLGLHDNIDVAPVSPLLKEMLKDFDVRVPQDVRASLKAGGLAPEEITHICLSHVHWDHVGNPAVFTKARFLLGGGSRELFEPGYPKDPTSLFPSDLLPAGRTDFLDVSGAEWKPIGPFPRALDYFGDGALYIVDAPGHLAGHLNILARTSSDGGWIYLAGDSAHDWRLLRGQGDIAVLHDTAHGDICMHVDKEEAAATIRKITEVMSQPRVRVILAHDNEWFEENKGGDCVLARKYSFAVRRWC